MGDDWSLYKNYKNKDETVLKNMIRRDNKDNYRIYPQGWFYQDKSNFTNKKLIHIKIQSKDFSKDNLWRFVATADKRFLDNRFLSRVINSTSQDEIAKFKALLNIWWSPDYFGSSSPRSLMGFLSDPYLTLFASHMFDHYKKGNPDQLAEDQRNFIEQWKRIWHLLQEYREKQRIGQKSDVLPFLPFPGEDAPPIPGLTIEVLNNTLKEAKIHGYEGVSCDPSYFHVAENLARIGFQFDNKKDREIFLKIKQSLDAMEMERWKNFLTSRKLTDIIKSYQDKDINKLEAKRKAEIQLKEGGQDVLFTPQERSWIVLLNSVDDKTLIPNEFKLYERDEKGGIKVDQDGNPIYLAWPTKPNRSVWMTLPTKKEKTEGDDQIVESAEKLGDNLIADYVITGYTLTKQKHYLDRLLQEKIKKPIIVYHMYARNSVVVNDDGTKIAKLNKQHLERIKSLISELGVQVIEEKGILGNVKNPGPNRPFGWEKDPESWIKNGIEKSWQRVLVITCDDTQRTKEVLKLLNQKAWYGNAGAVEGAWIVPDIRIFNFKSNQLSEELKDHFKDVILHIKNGNDGKISTMTTKSHRSLGDYTQMPILVHKSMKEFIRQNEEKNGAYEIYSR